MILLNVAYSDIPVSSLGDTAARHDFPQKNQGFTFELPSLGLMNTETVLTDAVSSVRKARAAERGAKAIEIAGSVFTQDELMQLRSAFRSVDTSDAGYISADGLQTVLYNLGMEPTNEDVDALLMELGATPDGIVTFVEFTGVLARLKV